MIDFGSCGTISHKFHRNLMEFYHHILDENLYGICRTMLATSEPLPPMDTETCINELLDVVRSWFFAMKSDDARWEEKCTGAIFMKMMQVAGQYGITSSPESVRFFRANFLYDSIIYRLSPSLDGGDVYVDWYKEYAKRLKKKMQREAKRRLTGPVDEDYASAYKMMKLNEKILGKLEEFVDTPRFSYNQGVGKVAFFMSLTIKTLLSVGITLLLIAGLRGGYDFFFLEQLGDEHMYIIDAFEWTLRSTSFHGLLFAWGLIYLRKLILKLDSLERKG